MLIVYKNDTKEIVGVFDNGNEHTKEDIFPHYGNDYTGLNIETNQEVLNGFNNFIYDDGIKLKNVNRKERIFNRLKQIDTEISQARVIDDILNGRPPHQRVLNLLAERNELIVELGGLQ